MKKIKEILIREYSAKPKKSLELVREGIDNDVYIFYNRNNTKIIARINKTGQIPSLKFEVELINKLVKSKVPTAKIVPTTSGKYFKKVNSRQAIICFEYVEGAPIDYGPEYTPRLSLVKQAGAALGQFHQATINLNLEEKRKRTIYSELEKALINSRKIINTFQDAETFINEVKKTLEKAKKGVFKSSQGVIHNDYNTSNILFKNHKLQAILDFDWACPGPLLMDVGYGAMSWSTAEKDAKPGKKAFSAFINSYNSTSPIKVNFNNSLWFWTGYSCLYLSCGFLSRMAIDNEYNLTSVKQSHMYRRFLYYIKKTS
ncbi:MAG: phosphotransferase [Candidatus Omnitrophota bacterium]